MATCVDIGGAQYPTEFDGKPIKPMEGVSLRPAFEGRPLHRPRPIFWEHEGNRAVLDPPWKLVALSGQPWRLYNIDSDRTEQHDLAATQPDRVKVLATKWDEYAARADVLPLGGWRANTRSNGRGSRTFSKAARFDLKMGDHLLRRQAPAIAGRAFTVTARFDARQPDGVIVAQGGVARGFALFLDHGKLTFLVRPIGGEAASIATASTVQGVHTAVARLQKDGVLSLVLDGQPVAQGKAQGLIREMPIDGLDVGCDTAGLVGPYTAENKFAGSIESVLVELK